jgi:hypothetical protein
MKETKTGIDFLENPSLLILSRIVHFHHGADQVFSWRVKPESLRRSRNGFPAVVSL